MFVEYAESADGGTDESAADYGLYPRLNWLAEDGPTHQAVEQLASLRLTPNFSTWRPCDQVEAAVGWKLAV